MPDFSLHQDAISKRFSQANRRVCDCRAKNVAMNLPRTPEEEQKIRWFYDWLDETGVSLGLNEVQKQRRVELYKAVSALRPYRLTKDHIRLQSAVKDWACENETDPLAPILLDMVNFAVKEAKAWFETFGDVMGKDEQDSDPTQ